MNTLSAFREAAELGFDYLETDVRATRDGVAVILHDGRLRRSTGVPGAVARLDWRDVRKADLGRGESVPTLADVLDAFPDSRVNIDIKAMSAVDPTVDVIERMKAHDRVLIASFSDRRRRRALRQLSKPVASAAGISSFLAVAAAKTPQTRAYAWRTLRDSDCLQLPPWVGAIPVITPGLVTAAHTAGLQVHAWTVDDPRAMNALLDIGVDGIITDRADLLRDVLMARNQWRLA